MPLSGRDPHGAAGAWRGRSAAKKRRVEDRSTKFVDAPPGPVLAAHPHYRHFQNVLGLARDGVAFLAGGFRSPASRGYAPVGDASGDAPSVGAAPSLQSTLTPAASPSAGLSESRALKKRLLELGLSTKGSKSELRARLASATPSVGAASFAAKEKAGGADEQRGSGGPHSGGGGGASPTQRTVVL